MNQSAQYLASLGYAVFPCAPNQKRPATPNGLLDASADPEVVEAMFRAAPANANLAIRTDGLLVIDIDGAANPWLADQPDRMLELAAAPLSLTPRGGKHFIFRQPEGKRFRNTAGKLAPAVDTRGDGGYILVPPSIVDGKPYRWGQALDCEPEQLGEPPAWLVEMLGATRQSTAQASGPIVLGDIPDGSRDDTLFRLASSMRKKGFSESAMLAALRTENSLRCKPPLPDSQVVKCAKSAAKYDPDPLAVITGLDPDEPPERGPADPGAFPEALLSVPGFIDDVVAWNLAGAHKPQPVLALAGALSLLATLTGRKITDPYGTRTNLYCLGVGESGCGKERAREVNKLILHQAGLNTMFREGFKSDAGLITAVEAQPAILFQVDEIGRMLRTLGNPSQSPHLYNIATVLMKLFTSSSSIFKGDAYADAKKDISIYQPHACLYGTTVPQSLYEGLTAESISDGFLSRMMIFETADNDPITQMPHRLEVPKRLIDEARYWGELRVGGNLSGENPQPIVVDYTHEAIERLGELESLARAERQSGSKQTASLWMRTTEKARKLAILWACSANRQEPLIDGRGSDWGASVSEFLTRKMLQLAIRFVAETPWDAKRKGILRLISSFGPNGASKTALNNRIPMPARERDEFISNLLEGGKIVGSTVMTKTKPVTRYVAAEFIKPINAA